MQISTLLLIDDDPEEQIIFKHALAEALPGTQLVAASSGMDALKLLQSAARLPDFIFMDVNLPLLSGFDTLEQIKQSEQLKHLPVIMYSTAIRRDTVARAAALGALNCIEKPSGYMELCSLLSSAFWQTEKNLIKQPG